jgi:hypothetical protein
MSSCISKALIKVGTKLVLIQTDKQQSSLLDLCICINNELLKKASGAMYYSGLIQLDMKTIGIIVTLSDRFEFITIC